MDNHLGESIFIININVSNLFSVLTKKWWSECSFPPFVLCCVLQVSFLFFNLVSKRTSTEVNIWSEICFQDVNTVGQYFRSVHQVYSYFFKDFIYLFLDRGKGGREEEKHQCVRDTSIGCISYAPNWGTGKVEVDPIVKYKYVTYLRVRSMRAEIMCVLVILASLI